MGHAKLLADLAHIAHNAAFVLHHAGAADHFQVRDFRKGHEDFILYTVSEKGVIRIATPVLKWKHRNALFWNLRGNGGYIPNQSVRYRSLRLQVNEQACYDKSH